MTCFSLNSKSPAYFLNILDESVCRSCRSAFKDGFEQSAVAAASEAERPAVNDMKRKEKKNYWNKRCAAERTSSPTFSVLQSPVSKIDD